MPILPYSAFARAKVVPKTGPHRVYGTLGDAYLQRLVIAALLDWTLAPDARDFNLDTLDGETAALTDVLARAGNLPFLSDYRVVLVQRAERLDGIFRSGEGGGDEEGDDEKPKGKGKAAPKATAGKQAPPKRLAEAIDKLPATTVLILARTPETPEPGARAGTPRCVHATVDKAIDRHGVVIDCTVGAKDTGRAVAIVNQEAARRRIALDQGAAAHLVARAGHDIAHLLNELDKCALRVGDGATVTAAVINEMTRPALHDTIFNLTDALGERRTAHAIGMLRGLIGSGEAPELILNLLTRHLRQLLQARACLDARLSLDSSLLHQLPRALAEQLPRDGRDNLAMRLQSQAWMGHRLAQQARNFSTPQLEAALSAALDTDLALKGIEGDGGPPELLMELLVTRLC